MRHSINLIILFLCFIQNIKAQNVISTPLDRDLYLANVKMMDEFFARFNGKEHRPDVSIPERKDEIMLLFNLAQFKSKQDKRFLEAKKFSEQVVNNNIILNPHDSCWFAKVSCNGTLDKSPVQFQLILKVESRGNNMYKWVIADANGDIFETSRDWEHKELFILPNDHELFFSSLYKVVNESYNFIDDYTLKGYRVHPLSVFLTLVRSGKLKVTHVSDLEFVFKQVPEYIFTVKYFKRKNKNAGWLISDFTQINNLN